MNDPLPYEAAVTINSLVHLVQLRWDGHEDMIPVLNDDDLAALNACFGTDWGDRGMGWDCDRPAATTIRALGEAQADTDDPYWQSLAELHASRKCPDCGGPFDHVLGLCGGVDEAIVGKVMCPHCGRLFSERGADGRYREGVPAHGDKTVVPGRRPGMYVCPGAGHVWRNPATDGRLLGNGEPNPYFHDFFEGRTSNATVGTVEVDRCSDDDCPVCGNAD